MAILHGYEDVPQVRVKRVHDHCGSHLRTVARVRKILEVRVKLRPIEEAANIDSHLLEQGRLVAESHGDPCVCVRIEFFRR